MPKLRTITTVERGSVPRKFRKAHSAAARIVWFETAKHHHVKHTPKRFDRGDSSDLFFFKRTKKYEQRKERVKGHNRRNVWSGRTERAARLGRISGTAHGGKIGLPGTGNLNFHKGGQEVRQFSKKEADILAAFWAKRYEREFERASAEIT